MLVFRSSKLLLAFAFIFLLLAALASNAQAAAATTAAKNQRYTQGMSGQQIEARLLDIYQLIDQAQNRPALALAEKLVRQQPNFQLGQMLYADLLLAQTRPVAIPGSAPEALSRAAPGVVTDLRAEAKARIKAMQERPPAGTLPENFLALSSRNQQAIAVDVDKSRLYFFQRDAAGDLQLAGDFYISIARLGAIKRNEGDLRTPLGPYFITSRLFPAQLDAFYGAGALPINYPNPYDLRRGKTGSGIWLHGTPPAQYSRAPRASEGCVVLTNPDFYALAEAAKQRTTPVVITHQINWVARDQGKWQADFDQAWQGWRASKLKADIPALADNYFANFVGSDKKNWSAFYRQLREEIKKGVRISEKMKDVSRVYWRESAGEELVVTTFPHFVAGKGKERRQYWLRKGNLPWRIIFEADL